VRPPVERLLVDVPERRPPERHAAVPQAPGGEARVVRDLSGPIRALEMPRSNVYKTIERYGLKREEA
jgi:hypothetical protein